MQAMGSKIVGSDGSLASATVIPLVGGDSAPIAMGVKRFVPSSSMGSRPMTALLGPVSRMGTASRLGTTVRGGVPEIARPMTAVRAAGYTSAGRSEI
jgi:hypothetical protein